MADKKVTIRLPDGKTVELPAGVNISANPKVVHIKKEDIVPVDKTAATPSGGSKTIQLENGKTITLVPGMNVPVPASADTIQAEGGKTVQVLANENIQLREENVQEILTAVPNWMIRWGNTLFCVLALLLIALAWVVKYPSVVSSPVTIINKFPGQEVYLQDNNRIGEILVTTGDEVKEGTPLLVLENSAAYKDVVLLKKAVTSARLNSHTFEFPFYQLPALSLGSLQGEYARLEESYLQYIIHKKDINNTRNTVHSQPENLTTQTVSNKNFSSFKKTVEDFYQLKSSLEAWEQKHIVKSEVNGTVQSIDSTRSNSGAVLSITPEQPAQYTALLKVPSLDFGKVKTAQQVNIKLQSYPEMQFGILEGEIKAISSHMDENNAYLVEVDLPKQLISSYNTKIPYQQDLVGTGEIITGQHRLLERFVPILASF